MSLLAHIATKRFAIHQEIHTYIADLETLTSLRNESLGQTDSDEYERLSTAVDVVEKILERLLEKAEH